ncbi:hypothetical protein Acr_00g0077080 [Actinidia rufa]|uniref:Uncharacterized protein n=1 Tax=Actinidia rufa TaxID=165716 RepID=A0A7J0DTP4_9ERIC|nr:hypothetical protein Acr_00g0077080 [Actinidia rufa]
MGKKIEGLEKGERVTTCDLAVPTTCTSWLTKTAQKLKLRLLNRLIAKHMIHFIWLYACLSNRWGAEGDNWTSPSKSSMHVVFPV